MLGIEMYLVRFIEIPGVGRSGIESFDCKLHLTRIYASLILKKFDLFMKSGILQMLMQFN